MKKFLASIASALVLVSGANAAITGGEMYGGRAFVEGGTFVQMDTSTPFSIGNDTLQSINFFAFDEQQDITITEDVNVDFGTPLKAGDIVSSHFIAFDPITSVRGKARIDFDGEIYAVAYSDQNLRDSNQYGAANVTYLDPDLAGIERPTDNLRIDGNSIYLSLYSRSPGDFLRIFTVKTPEMSVMPIPAGSTLMLTALAGLYFARRRKAA